MVTPRINYIVCFYAGGRRHYPLGAPLLCYVEKHIEFLKNRCEYITGATFVFNDHPSDIQSKVITKAEEYFKSDPDLRSRIIIRKNAGISYGAWDEGIRDTYPDFTHSFLMEDDYIIPYKDGKEILNIFLSKDKPEVKYVCCTVSHNYKLHAGNGAGLINHVVVSRCIKENDGKLFKIIDDNSYHHGAFLNQIEYLDYLEGELVDIMDLGYVQFLDSQKVINLYGDTNKLLIKHPVTC